MKACKELNKTIRGFSPDVVNIFSSYNWPGNLREMNNVVKRAALLSDGEYIELSSLPQEMIYSQKFNFVNASAQSGNNTHPDFAEAVRQKPEKTVNLKSAALYAECEMIMDVLRQVNFNKTKAAQLLNIDRKTLYNKMKALDLEP
jgi:two-component system response regulator HydG